MTRPQRTFQFVFENTLPSNYGNSQSRSESVSSNNNVVPQQQVSDASSQEPPVESSPLPTQEEYLTPQNESPEDTSEPTSVRVVWNDRVTWIFLQIMFGIQDFLSKTGDALVKNRVWNRSLDLFREQLRINYSNNLDQVRIFFSRNFKVKKMQDQWDRMKTKYRELKNLNGMTGIGGTHPNINWIFYDEVGKILANDRNIHPRAVVATSINDEGPSITVLQHEIPGDLSSAERDAVAREKARRNGIQHLPLRTIKEKILDPSGRYAILRQARSTNNASRPTEDVVTGAGRQTRSGERDENNANALSNVAQSYRALFEEAIAKSDEKANERMQEFHRLALERDRLRLERIEQILREQRRLDREEREEFFNRRSAM